MKQRTVYWLPSIRGMVLLSALLMAGSGLIRAAWAIGEPELSPSIFLFQVLLPLWANLCFVWILFLDGRERLYRSAIPVWLGCAFFAVKAFYFVSILHTVLCLLLYALVAALYAATVIGVIPTQVFLWPLFGLPMLYHILVESRQKTGWTLHEWLPELSVLCCMAALLCLSLSMRRRPVEEGGLIRRFGDRNDGRRLRTLSPIFAVSPFLMKTRNTSQNFIADQIELTAVDRYIAEKRRAGWKGFGVLHVILAAYVRACARYPGLNRFIAGQRVYTRDRVIEVNMTIKKEMSTDSPDTVIKVTFDPADTAETVIRRFDEQVQRVKQTPLNSSFDKLAGTLNLIPGLLLRGVVALLQAGDYFGLLPRRLTVLSPFHGSLFITSMASLGIPPIHHHLYDFGNVPVFCSFGKKRRVYETKRDGTVILRKYVDCNFVTDERIVDGFYYASAIRYIHGLMNDPWQLDVPPEVVNRDQL
ncbi:hypothetical protein [uncultured Oscillibacter sp.]|jgi:hypothetical protein|uniref:hypothetical protein n=1 Tax=uncultured Oscillibacter sp. TaxID=876091 RepID=UPI0025DB3CB1|nr:hypothetical protein [uncultured Oscillibacter sp.]